MNSDNNSQNSKSSVVKTKLSERPSFKAVLEGLKDIEPPDQQSHQLTVPNFDAPLIQTGSKRKSSSEKQDFQQNQINQPLTLNPNEIVGVYTPRGNNINFFPTQNEQLMPTYENSPVPPKNSKKTTISKNTPSQNNPVSVATEAASKRQERLTKNKEAARQCRLKKKEYIKCLENRVEVLESQNKALIDELKNLKDFYNLNQ